MKRLFLFVCFLTTLHTVKAAAGLQPATAAPKLNGDTTFARATSQIPLNSYESQIKHRLDSLRKDIPLDYNEFVQNYINLYLQNRDEMAHVIGLAKYYFPIYEKAFRNAGIPPEIEYLSIVESKLDPNAVSRVGATGPWQFMSTTAKMYGLNMDDYVDERRDPVRASYAAAAYLKDAYEEFGDWLLAIASYNCGKSNIENAMTKSGGTDFWSVRQYLPAETRNYVPAYIAVAYVMNCYSKHNIIPQACQFGMKMDTLLVDKFVSLSNISGIIGVDVKLLSVLNPVYRTYIVNGTAATPRRLIVPQTSSDKFSALYDALNTPASGLGWLHFRHHKHEMLAENRADRSPAYHKVKRGETLAMIADHYGIDEAELKTLNHIHHNKAEVGQRLKISKG